MDIEGYWPSSLAHLARPCESSLSDLVVVAEVSDESHGAYPGHRISHTALVPKKRAEMALSTIGGIGWDICSSGPHPCVETDQIYEPKFWIEGRDGEKLEPLVKGWLNHDKRVLIPDTSFLMTYGLIPRILENGTICWDDPCAPVYDVLRVRPLHQSRHGEDSDKAIVEIRRDYLEDYCLLKHCVPVLVYYEERYSSDDDSIDYIIRRSEGEVFKLRGRELVLKRLQYPTKGLSQLAQVWGCTKIIDPEKRHVSDDSVSELSWPGLSDSLREEEALQMPPDAFVYVRDAVLKPYEESQEYEVMPLLGAVDYGGHWAVSYIHRFGRNYLQLEIKKLYEGCPPHLIGYWNEFAVSPDEANRDLEIYGEDNIAKRAESFVAAFLDIVSTLEKLATSLDLAQDQKDIAGIDSDEVAYHGWWRVVVFSGIGDSFQLNASESEFHQRVVKLYKVLECIRKGPLKSILSKLGVNREDIVNKGSIKLLATLCQFCHVVKVGEYELPDESTAAISDLKGNPVLDELVSIFAVQTLRNLESHLPSIDRTRKINELLQRIGIDAASTRQGWGEALDSVYDRVTADLRGIESLLNDLLTE